MKKPADAQRGESLRAFQHSHLIALFEEPQTMQDNLDVYHNYAELSRAEKMDMAYRIVLRRGSTGFGVLAPHGGGIEPGTTEIADAAAGNDHGFYSLEGIMRTGNARLHITSSRFDEPLGSRLASESNSLLVLHGCQGNPARVFLGGLDFSLRLKVATQLGLSGFETDVHPDLPGEDPRNICNRSRACRGVQLELTRGLRRQMFADLSREGRRSPTESFFLFVSALREALSSVNSGLHPVNAQDGSQAE